MKDILKFQRKKLEASFQLLKSKCVDNKGHSSFAVSYESFEKLIKCINPNKSDAKIKILFAVLDISKDNCLRMELYFKF